MRFVPTHTQANAPRNYNTSTRYVIEVPPSVPLIQSVRTLAAQGGGKIQLGPYTYLITGTLNLLTGVTIAGIPGATKIQLTTGDGPVVRVFNGARLMDCEIELSRDDGTTFTKDQEPSGAAWENSVVHLCEPFFQDRKLTALTSDHENGWQGNKYGAGTISGCYINTLISKTRGIYVGLYGVFGYYSATGTNAALTDDFLHSRVINNSITPTPSSGVQHACIYYKTGTYYGVCTGNICAGSDPLGALGVIKYDGGATGPRIAFGGEEASTSFVSISSNVAQYDDSTY